MAGVETSSSPQTQKDRTWRQKFEQQELEAFQPILTAETVWKLFIGIGVIFIAIGIPLLVTSEGVWEMQLDYTECLQIDGEGETCQEYLKNNLYNISYPSCKCNISFNISQDIPDSDTVYMYYGLDNFYQNHRRYVQSRDDRQLNGKVDTKVDSDCKPYDIGKNGLNIAPCGSIANSMFNDTLNLKLPKDGNVNLIKKNIAWPSDKDVKFKNPSLESFNKTDKPPNWKLPVKDIGGYENEAFIVWMRSAAFPSFRKLYAKFNGEYKKDDILILDIEYNYPVHTFEGRKRMILSTNSFLGGKNNFLGIAYITVGSICVLLGIMFLIIKLKFGKSQNFPNSPSS